ncbi:hypothetical protein cce_4012 [Crocosphaera subtropica ATCC 51142]|uniref:Uncharacterized protein n=1 Tax=Crocosphaera subtropica (strain ATCC 51142 / BH68) TaxID=43989 RepID=B1WQQ8_CROS5|nr:hypothetical protein [Crocosphaera subtropica]ACB53360.1 hypothetical protein cce_4012 [Crocosphaera subtropica ATCC 51142]
MNKIVNNTLRFINLWAKMEIIAALVLTVIILGYAVFPKSSQTRTQSPNEVPSTIQR